MRIRARNRAATVRLVATPGSRVRVRLERVARNRRATRVFQRTINVAATVTNVRIPGRLRPGRYRVIARLSSEPFTTRTAQLTIR